MRVKWVRHREQKEGEEVRHRELREGEGSEAQGTKKRVKGVRNSGQKN